MNKSYNFDKNVYQKTLADASNHVSEIRFQHRLHCVTLIEQGCSYSQVSEWFGEHPRTIERWVQNAHEFGVEGLKDEQKPGRPTKIRDDQKRVLKTEIAKLPTELGYKASTWNGKLLMTHLSNKYDVDLGLRQCQRLLNSLKEESRQN